MLGSSGITLQTVLDSIASAITGLPTSFVASGAAMTVANLLTNFPPSVTYNGLYARVTDLYGSVDDIMRCRYDGTAYKWVPQRESFNGTTAATSGAVSITPLVTPPTLRATGNLLGNISFTPSVTNAYKGQRQKVVMEGTLDLNIASITGLLGSNLTLLGGNSHTIEFNGTSWFSAD